MRNGFTPASVKTRALLCLQMPHIALKPTSTIFIGWIYDLLVMAYEGLWTNRTFCGRLSVLDVTFRHCHRQGVKAQKSFAGFVWVLAPMLKPNSYPMEIISAHTGVGRWILTSCDNAWGACHNVKLTTELLVIHWKVIFTPGFDGKRWRINREASSFQSPAHHSEHHHSIFTSKQYNQSNPHNTNTQIKPHHFKLTHKLQ